ncbi:MAG: SIR2 family NAD-dependent protein deacylase [Phycisphaerales bacterium]
MPESSGQSELTAAAGALARARRVAVLTGAGVSAESGLRTFRGATAADLPADMQALWKEFDPMRLATPEAFDADPAMVTRWYDWRRLGCLAAEPNPGHRALATLEGRLGGASGSFHLLTQNVDRLHQKAGSRNVVELHGSIIEWRCVRTGRAFLPPPEPFESFPPPSPHAAGAVLRPNVVWFGEALPEAALAAAYAAAESCDLFMSVGTSSVVYPAAGFLDVASANGAVTIEVNREPTPISERVDHCLLGRSGEVLPALLRAAFDADAR